MGRSHGDHSIPGPHRPPLEAAQWVVRCQSGLAWVADDFSTHGAVVLRGGVMDAARVPAEEPFRLAMLDSAIGGRRLVHPGELGLAVDHLDINELDWAPLGDGDGLVTVYEAFLFCGPRS